MAVAARPADIDEGALAYCRKKLGARVVILLVTRGEGTESWTRPELDQEIGVVRTREAIALARVVGADVAFLNLRDFGYSNSADEALAIWGHDEALRRMVHSIRSIRPDVIITNHGVNSGDGMERAVAQLLTEAFQNAAAGAPASDGLEPFQPWRLFRKVKWTHGRISQDIVRLDLDRYDAVRGLTYGQVGLRAHHQLRSYAGDLDRLTPEWEKAYYQLQAAAGGDVILRHEMIPTSLFDGLVIPEKVARAIPPPWPAEEALWQVLARRDAAIEKLKEKLIEKRVEGDPSQLHARYGSDFARVIRFTQALERSLALLIGFSIKVSLSDHVVVGGQKLVATIEVENHSDSVYPVSFRMPVSLQTDEQKAVNAEPVNVVPGIAAIQEQTYVVPDTITATLPHAEHLREEDYYAIGSTLPGAQPDEPFGARFIGSVEIGLGQVTIPLTALARFDVGPRVDVSTVSFAIVRDWSTISSREIRVKLRNNTPGPLTGALWVVPLAVSEDNYEPLHVVFFREDEEVSVILKLNLPILKPPLSPDILLEFRKERTDRVRTPAEVRAEPQAAELLGSARIKVKAVDAQVATGIRVGVVSATDSWLRFVLDQLGVQNEEIEPASLGHTVHGNAAYRSQSVEGCADLSVYNSIVIDERAYFARPELLEKSWCLLDYVSRGGNLVILRQRPDDFRLLLPRSRFAPYPLALAETRITMENATVRIIDNQNPLLLRPNLITFKDFEGWVDELAADIPRQWAAQYKAPLESGDPGAERQRGMLLTARYGDGNLIYTSLLLRRQLLAMNSGAYRLLANLISPAALNGKQAR
jgi:LmbE family N-acetylglucosaminyl deacetylase